jgi:hypothetical protein
MSNHNPRQRCLIGTLTLLLLLVLGSAARAEPISLSSELVQELLGRHSIGELYGTDLVIVGYTATTQGALYASAGTTQTGQSYLDSLTRVDPDSGNQGEATVAWWLDSVPPPPSESVPEPSTLLLLTSGMAVVALVASRQVLRVRR